MFVYGGSGNEDSVEFITVGNGRQWQIIWRTPKMTLRSYLALAVLNEHQIACFGGSGCYFGFVLDVRDYSVKNILGAV